MRKIVFIIAILFVVSITFGLAQNANNGDKQWSKVNNFIYIDKSSITKKKYSVSGWFKIYNSPESELYSVTDKNVHYELIEYEVDCKDPSISIAHSKSYDKNNNLLYEEVNSQGVGCSCPCMTYDDIYLRELCK